MKRYYTALLHGVDEGGDIGVSFPDFPGCVASGENIGEALQNAKEGLEFHIEGMIEEKLSIPERSDRKKEAVWIKECKESVRPALLEVEIPEMEKERINITLSRYVLNKIDAYAKPHNKTRSAFLAEAALNYMAKNA